MVAMSFVIAGKIALYLLVESAKLAVTLAYLAVAVIGVVLVVAFIATVLEEGGFL